MPSDELVLALLATYYHEYIGYSVFAAEQRANQVRDYAPGQWRAWQAVAEKAIEVGL